MNVLIPPPHEIFLLKKWKTSKKKWKILKKWKIPWKTPPFTTQPNPP